jgi:hypothetical protein
MLSEVRRTGGEVFIVDVELDGVDLDIGFALGEVMRDVDVGVRDHLDSSWGREYSWSFVIGGSSLFLESCSYERLSMQLYIMRHSNPIHPPQAPPSKEGNAPDNGGR